MKLKLLCATFVLVSFSSYTHAQDWGEVSKSLETIGKILEEGERAKREGRKADMDAVYGYTNELIDYKQQNHQRKQQEQQRLYDQQRAAQQRAYENSAQYKHNQKLMKAIKNEKTNGYGSANYYEQERQRRAAPQPTYQPYTPSSTRYRPRQPSTGNDSQGSAGYTPNYGSNNSSGYTQDQSIPSKKPSGLTVNQSRSTYVPGKNANSYSGGNTYDVDELDASGTGLHDVAAPTSNQASSSGSYGGYVSPGRCLEWVEVPPYPCGDIFGIAQAGGASTGTCNTRCSKYEYQ